MKTTFEKELEEQLFKFKEDNSRLLDDKDNLREIVDTKLKEIQILLKDIWEFKQQLKAKNKAKKEIIEEIEKIKKCSKCRGIGTLYIKSKPKLICPYCNGNKIIYNRRLEKAKKIIEEKL